MGRTRPAARLAGAILAGAIVAGGCSRANPDETASSPDPTESAPTESASTTPSSAAPSSPPSPVRVRRATFNADVAQLARDRAAIDLRLIGGRAAAVFSQTALRERFADWDETIDRMAGYTLADREAERRRAAYVRLGPAYSAAGRSLIDAAFAEDESAEAYDKAFDRLIDAVETLDEATRE